MATITPPRPHRCRSCGAPIYWATTEVGKSMPVDAAPTERGTVQLVLHEGKVHGRVLGRDAALAHTAAALETGRGPRLRLSHFVTCPAAKRHRVRDALAYVRQHQEPQHA